MRRVVVYIERLLRRRQIARLRYNLMFFGIDTSHLSDDEIMEKTLEVGHRLNEAASALAVSTQKATDAFRKFSEAMAKVDMSELSK